MNVDNAGDVFQKAAKNLQYMGVDPANTSQLYNSPSRRCNLAAVFRLMAYHGLKASDQFDIDKVNGLIINANVIYARYIQRTKGWFSLKAWFRWIHQFFSDKYLKADIKTLESYRTLRQTLRLIQDIIKQKGLVIKKVTIEIPESNEIAQPKIDQNSKNDLILTYDPIPTKNPNPKIDYRKSMPQIKKAPNQDTQVRLNYRGSLNCKMDINTRLMGVDEAVRRAVYNFLENKTLPDIHQEDWTSKQRDLLVKICVEYEDLSELRQHSNKYVIF